VSRAPNTLERLIAATATPVLAQPARARREAVQWVKLDATVPHQQQDNWCWCATALGVHRFYEPGFAASQCEVANTILQRDDACADPTSPDINSRQSLRDALARMGNFRAPRVDSAVSFDEVRAEIDRGALLGTRIEFPGAVGHFMVIEGYLPGPEPQIAIHDPKFDESSWAYDQYVAAYQGDGTWTHSYRTQSHRV
jgi:Papain-like cysteine protease AvrRpt2